MDDAMIDLMADDGMLRRRLDAYASARLSPDAAASARLRARVLAVAHRQAADVRADTRLSLLPAAILDASHPVAVAARRSSARRGGTVRRSATLLLAASLALGAVAGTAFAASPGGALYGARVWAETLTLPSDSSARAVTELDRLSARLTEASTASAAGDVDAATAALRAYENIVNEATAHAIAAGDEVATAALQAGVGQNVAVLTRLVAALPVAAQPAVGRALQHAIDRSNDAIDAIGSGPGGNGGANGGNGGANGGNGGNGPTVAPTKEPKPTKATDPTDAPDATRTPRPDPAKTPKPAKTPPVDPGPPTSAPGGPPTPEPGATPRPTRRGGG